MKMEPEYRAWWRRTLRSRRDTNCAEKPREALKDITEGAAHECKTEHILIFGAFFKDEAQNVLAKLEDWWCFALHTGKESLKYRKGCQKTFGARNGWPLRCFWVLSTTSSSPQNTVEC